MNQSVAPTSFITSISRRRREDRRSDRVPDQQDGGEQQEDGQQEQAEPEEALQLADQTDLVLRKAHVVDAGELRELVRHLPEEVDIGALGRHRFELSEDGVLGEQVADTGFAGEDPVGLGERADLVAVFEALDELVAGGEGVADEGELVLGGGRVHEHDHLDAAFPAGEEIVEGVLAEQGQADTEQRDRCGDDRRDGERGVAAETVEGFAECVSKS